MKETPREEYIRHLQRALDDLQVISSRFQQRGDIVAVRDGVNRWKEATLEIIERYGASGGGRTFRDHVDFDVLGLTGGYVLKGLEKYEHFLKDLLKTISTSNLGDPVGPTGERAEDFEDNKQPRTSPRTGEEERNQNRRRVRNRKRVFVVHGRNEAARVAMFQFLRALGLEPIEWGEAVAWTGTGTPYVGTILDHAFEAAQAVIVLFTGDDLARLGARYLSPSDPPEESALTPQPRPNVLFEAGMAFGRHPEWTILVVLGQCRPFSDIAGLHVVRMDDSPAMRQELISRLKSAGCATEQDGRTDWLREGAFEGAIREPDIDNPEAGSLRNDSSSELFQPSVQTMTVAPRAVPQGKSRPPLSQVEAGPILSMLQSEYHETKVAGLQRVADLAFQREIESDNAVLSMVEQLTTLDNPTVCRSAFRALGDILRAAPEGRQGVLRERMIPVITGGITAGVREVRQEAIQAASAIPDDRIVNILIKLLHDLPDDEAPEGQTPSVAYALRAFAGKKPEILARLMELSAHEGDGKIRRRILKSIEEIRRQ